MACAACGGRGYLTSLDCAGRVDACHAAVEERHPCSCQPDGAGRPGHTVVGRPALEVRRRAQPRRPFGFADRSPSA